ncbi:DNA polymerase IV [Cephaloticoccus primus]|uniref:DNA polymerase IV n=1 Tax=Cephaloticoccus primus TaxID=1548207 RepID=A0A139SHW5_9BACT|nr:DNA polymerase IV [Cephaloticoccus primus]KXU34136.1 DNA polymerase IV [Cephaloticoccus primus]
MRKILHVDMDAFFASVEQRDTPSLRGRPVVVAKRGARSVVCAASYEARQYGIHSAMPALRAERLCPDAIFVPPDFPRYEAVSRQVRAIFLAHTDLVEPLSLDEAYLDVTAPRIPLPSATATAKAIRAHIREATGLTASAGVAPNKFIAKIASDWNKPDGLCVVRPAQVDAFLISLPVARLPGVGKVTQQQLARLRVSTVGELRCLPLDLLLREFGRFGLSLYRCARGVDERPVEPEQPVRSLSSEDTFPEDLPLCELPPLIRRLAERTWESRLKTDRSPRTVVLKLKTAQFRILTRSRTPETPPHSLGAFTRVALGLLERVNLPADTRYRLAGVGLAGFCEKKEDAQTSIWF